MERAEDLFLRLIDRGATAVDDLIAERASEELFLEFKRSADDGAGNQLHERDRANLKKSIGGFANSEGGIVVWGVECSKKADVGDVAAVKRPISNPEKFRSWLEGAVSGCTVPPVVGVRSAVIGDGFVVTYVPQSSHAPHQIAGEGKYLIRAGSDFLVAPHGVVAGLFGRPPHPSVFANFVIEPAVWGSDGIGTFVAAQAYILICNNSQVVAEDLYLSGTLPGAVPRGQGHAFDSNVTWQMTSALGFDKSWVCPPEFRLAPGGSVNVATVKLIVYRKPIVDFRCNLTIGCKGAIPFRTELCVTREELEADLQVFFDLHDAKDDSLDLADVSQRLLGLTKMNVQVRPF